MQIAVATKADIEELTQVEIQSKLQSFAANEPVAIDQSTRLYRWQTYFRAESPATSKRERIVFKAVDDVRIVGFIAGHLTTRYDMDAEIQNFYILKSYQRQGIGADLLKHLVAWLQQQQIQSLCVGIDPENPYQQFYLKQGGRHLNPHWMVWDNLNLLLEKLA
jgi:GNAT superfamily N-acetyltransferase